jgi:hypothetical protein
LRDIFWIGWIFKGEWGGIKSHPVRLKWLDSPLRKWYNYRGEVSLLRGDMKKSLLIISILLLGVGTSYGTTRTVGPGKTHATIQAAIDASKADTGCGDVINIYDDTYDETVTVDGFNCSSGSPLTIQAASGETSVVMDGSDDVKRAFWVKSSSHITLTGPITIKNYKSPQRVDEGTHPGIIHIGDPVTTFMIIDNITLHAEGQSDNQSKQTPSYHEEFANYGTHGINIKGGCNDTVIKNSTIYGQGNGDAAYPVDKALIVNGLTYRVYLYNNYVESGDDYNFWVEQCYDCTLEYNYFDGKDIDDTGEEALGIYVMTRHRESERMIVRYNVYDFRGSNVEFPVDIYENSSGAQETENHIFHNNTILGGTLSSVRVGNVVTGVKFYNNIMWSGDGATYGIEFAFNNSDDWEIYNNIFHGTAANLTHDYVSSTDIVETDNLDSWNITTLTNDVSVFPDPYLKYDDGADDGVNDGIDFTSLDNGNNERPFTGVDYAGAAVPRETLYDIGAFEFQPSVSNDDVSMVSGADSALADIVVGTSDELLKFKLQVTGGAGDNSAQFTSVKVKITGTFSSDDIADVQLYKEDGTTDGTWQIGEDTDISPPGSTTYSAGYYSLNITDQTITDTASVYFYVVVTLKSSADTSKTAGVELENQTSITISTLDAYITTAALTSTNATISAISNPPLTSPR